MNDRDAVSPSRGTMNKETAAADNRETTIIKLWLNNERDYSEYWKVETQRAVAQHGSESAAVLAGQLEDWTAAHRPETTSQYSDLLTIALSRVDWAAVAEMLISDHQEEADTVLFHSYSRAQAIADGILIDVSDLAREAGFRYPVAMTAAAWIATVEVPPSVADFQDEKGRLWDVLSVLRIAARASRGAEVFFTVSVVVGEERSKEIRLKSICGPGDTPAPVLTIMLPHED